MNGIKILLITSVLFIAIYFYLRLKKSLFDLILLLLLFGAAVVFILFPESTNKLAHKLGVGSPIGFTKRKNKKNSHKTMVKSSLERINRLGS